MQSQAASTEQLMTDTREVLLAAGIRRAWALPGSETCASPKAEVARVLATLADELPPGVDPVEHVLKLEWVLHSVHGRPVTVRLYFREQVLPRSAVPVLDLTGEQSQSLRAPSAPTLH